MKRLNRWLNQMTHLRRACRELVDTGFRIAADGRKTVILPPPGFAPAGLLPGTGGLLPPSRPVGFSPAAFTLVAASYRSPDEQQRAFMLAEYLTYGTLARDGWRCVAPTPAECEALARTDVTLAWADYRQPFPAVAVALPEGYPTAGPDLQRPGAVLALHQPGSRSAVFVLIGDGSEPDRPLVSTFSLPDPADASAVGEWIDDPKRDSGELLVGEVAAMRAAVRLAMNACLLSSTDGHRRVGPANPAYAAKLRDSLAKKRLPPTVRAANEQALADIPDLYNFARPPAVSRTAGDPDPTGREMSSHWRRGHWANLACGTGRADRRLHFRPPVMVRADRLATEAA